MEKRFLSLVLFFHVVCYAQLPVVPIALSTASTVPPNPNGFTNIPGLYIQLLALDTTNYVTSTNTWLDLSGKTNNFISPANVPAYFHDGPNGYYSVNFGSNTVAKPIYLNCMNDTTTNCPNTIMIVATEACTTGTNYLFDSKVAATLGRDRIGISTSGNSEVYAGDSVLLPNFNNNSNWMILSAVFNGVNTAVRKNGSNLKIVPGVGGHNMEQLMIGNNQPGTRPYNGQFAAVLVWGKALSTNEVAYGEGLLNNIFNLGFTITSNGFDPGTIWAERVVTNGAAYPSANSKVAITACLEGLISDLVYSSLGSMVLYPTDSVIAASTPVMGLIGNFVSPTLAADPWINHNFVSGDLTVNGLKGNTTTKYLDTGINANTALTLNNTALFTYIISTNASSGGDIDSQTVGNTQVIGLYATLSGTAYSDQYDSVVSNGRISAATRGPGYYAGSRVSNTSHRLYYAKGATAHTTLATSSVTSSSLPSFNIFAHALNNGGTPALWSDSTYGAMGVSVGLSTNQSSALYNRLVTFRTAMGGTNP